MSEPTKHPPADGSGERECVNVPKDIPDEGVRMNLTPEQIAELKKRGYDVTAERPNDVTVEKSNEDWRNYESDNYAPTPSRNLTYYGAEFDDLVETAPKPQEPSSTPPPVEGTESTDIVTSSTTLMPQATGPAVGEPDAGENERLKEKDNEFFAKMEELVTAENIDGMAQMLKSYAGVDLPADKLKKILPNIMPLLRKYGNRVFASENTGKFVAYSAEASKYAEFAKDAKPLLASIVEAVMEPPKDEAGNIVLRPEDEQKFDRMEEELDKENLSAFLKDDGSDGKTQESPLPLDIRSQTPQVTPRRMTTTGRGGSQEEYSAPQTKPKKPVFESLDELNARYREKVGAANFDSSMAESKRREQAMNERPNLVSVEEELRRAEAREKEMRAQPMLEQKATKSEMDHTDDEMDEFFKDSDLLDDENKELKDRKNSSRW